MSIDNDSEQLSSVMLKKIDKIYYDTDKKRNVYNELESVSIDLITRLLKLNNIEFHQISSRIKEGKSLRKKIQEKIHKYKSSDDVTDFLGLRIITYMEKDIDSIARVIKSEFEVDSENSVDKRERSNDSFGYKSLHFVVKMNEYRLFNIENSKFEGLKFEIQIRSILQHAWAAIEHGLGYKGEGNIPEVYKRDFNRIAAILETADIAFVALENELQQYRNKTDQAIKDNVEDIVLDNISLESFIDNNATIIEIEHEGNPDIDRYDKVKNGHLDVEALRLTGITTTKDLESHLNDYRDIIIYFIKNKIYFTSIKPGIALRCLPLVLAAKEGERNLIDFLNAMGDSGTNTGLRAKMVMDSYSKVAKHIDK